MVDEIVTEKRVRWDSKTNRILGICREHEGQLNLTFDSLADVEELVKALREGRVHYASEVSASSVNQSFISHASCFCPQATVAAIGFLTSNR